MKEIMEQELLDYMRRADYRPLNKSELARALEVPSNDRAELRQLLKKLEHEGTILRAKKGRFVLREADEQTLMGTYRRSPGWRDGELAVARGETAGGGDGASTHRVRLHHVVIPAGHEATALHGDRVLVRLRRATPEAPHWLKHLPKDKQERLRARYEARPDRLEGEVIKVVERVPRRIVGTLSGEGSWATIAPDDPRYPDRIDLPGGLPQGAEAGYKALATIVSWESVRRRPEGEILRVLGPADAPGVDVLSIIHKHGLPTEFPDEVLAEAEEIAPGLDEASLAEREDWRDVEVITIDPFDARDFDDAIAVKPLPNDGGWELAVHIADVSHYVQPRSALDREASKRGNSVYLVDRVLPMLPEALSNGICSLRPNEDRLTFCAVMRFDSGGRRLSARFCPAVIRSQKRLTYEEAFDRLQKKEPGDTVTALLERAWELASVLRRRRFRAGSLDLDFPESKVILDEKGRPTEIRVVENDRSHQLIEEFMLAANEAVAETILRSGRPSLYRIHDEPDPDKLLEFRESVLTHGYNIEDLTHRSELQKLLQQLRGQADEPVLKLGLLKSMKRAAYHADSLGHYGLAKEHYTHFTSPIRRYTDLVVHRVLRHLLNHSNSEGATPHSSYKAMGEMAKHLSQTERAAAEAESETKRLKVMQFFERRSRENPPARLEAVVTDVARLGLFVELVGYGTRGLIRAHDLPGDRRYRYDPRGLRFDGGKGRVFQLGDRLEVEIVRVDQSRGFIDVRPVLQETLSRSPA